jgi:hypothetical protein
MQLVSELQSNIRSLRLSTMDGQDSPELLSRTVNSNHRGHVDEDDFHVGEFDDTHDGLLGIDHQSYSLY